MKAERLACHFNRFILIQLQTNNYLHIALRNKLILPFTQRRRTITSHDNVYQSLPVIVCHFDRIYQNNLKYCQKYVSIYHPFKFLFLTLWIVKKTIDCE